ncbi:hypothetical protein IKD98_04155 [Candidatus Saccharibacteria bacterium]|nr:hypothetical protein [Candidatus Saccharibacteria bacterium]
MPKKEYSVIVPREVYPKPTSREMTAAYILNGYFKSDIKFITRGNNKTPDFQINGLYWELKTPTGNGKYNLQHALRNAAKQSENIIIDARFSKIHISRINNELKYQFNHSKNIKRLLLITKQKKLIEFSK